MEEYCIYLRKSRVDAETDTREGVDTLSRHRAALIQLAETCGLRITHCYEEVRSGETIAARPEMQRLLSDVEGGRWAGVLVMEVERLARGNTTDQGIVADTFKCTNTKIITPTKMYDPNNEFDEEYFEFGLFMSRREYKTINRRLQRGRKASLEEGKYIAGKAAYGYERYKIPTEKGYTLQPLPEQAAVVRQIFEWYVAGSPQPNGTVCPLGALSIAKKLDAQGIPSPSGGKWPSCTVLSILKNPTYTGMIRWSYRPTRKCMTDSTMKITRRVSGSALLAKGLHPAIVDQALWNSAQHILETRAHTSVTKGNRVKNPLAGLVFCANCGRSMERRTFHEGRDFLVCPDKDCGCVSSVLEDVETATLEALGLWLSGYQVRPELPPWRFHGLDKDKTVTRLRHTISALEKQMETLCDLLEQGVYTTIVFEQRVQILSSKLVVVREELTQSMAEQTPAQEIVSPFHRVEHLLSIYPRLTDPQEKNVLLKGVLDRAIYVKTQGGRWKESDLRLYLFPKINAC